MMSMCVMVSAMLGCGNRMRGIVCRWSRVAPVRVYGSQWPVRRTTRRMCLRAELLCERLRVVRGVEWRGSPSLLWSIGAAFLYLNLHYVKCTCSTCTYKMQIVVCSASGTNRIFSFRNLFPLYTIHTLFTGSQGGDAARLGTRCRPTCLSSTRAACARLVGPTLSAARTSRRAVPSTALCAGVTPPRATTARSMLRPTVRCLWRRAGGTSQRAVSGRVVRLPHSRGARRDCSW
jgi:hypothetical protein